MFQQQGQCHRVQPSPVGAWARISLAVRLAHEPQAALAPDPGARRQPVRREAGARVGGAAWSDGGALLKRSLQCLLGQKPGEGERARRAPVQHWRPGVLLAGRQQAETRLGGPLAWPGSRDRLRGQQLVGLAPELHGEGGVEARTAG